MKRRILDAIETAWVCFVFVAILIWVLPDFLPKRRRK